MGVQFNNVFSTDPSPFARPKIPQSKTNTSTASTNPAQGAGQTHSNEEPVDEPETSHFDPDEIFLNRDTSLPEIVESMPLYPRSLSTDKSDKNVENFRFDASFGGFDIFKSPPAADSMSIDGMLMLKAVPVRCLESYRYQQQQPISSWQQ